jgi:hypothetical protein
MPGPSGRSTAEISAGFTRCRPGAVSILIGRNRNGSIGIDGEVESLPRMPLGRAMVIG